MFFGVKNSKYWARRCFEQFNFSEQICYFIFFFLLFSIKFDIRRTAFCWKGDLVCFVFVVKLLCQYVRTVAKEIYEVDIHVSLKVVHLTNVQTSTLENVLFLFKY